MSKANRHDLHVVQSARCDIVVVQLGTNDLSFRPRLLVGSDLENSSSACSMILMAFSLFVNAKLFVVAGQCRSTKMLTF